MTGVPECPYKHHLPHACCHTHLALRFFCDAYIAVSCFIIAAVSTHPYGRGLLLLFSLQGVAVRNNVAYGGLGKREPRLG